MPVFQNEEKLRVSEKMQNNDSLLLSDVHNYLAAACPFLLHRKKLLQKIILN